MNRLISWVHRQADRVRDVMALRWPHAPVLLVAASAGISAIAYVLLARSALCENGRPPQVSAAAMELTFSAHAFSSLVRSAQGCGSPVDSLKLLLLDTLFPVTYAFCLSMLVVWLERWRCALPDRGAIARADMSRPFTLAESMLVLLPFVAAIADVLPENVALYIAARSVAGTHDASAWLVMLGSVGAAVKWSLIGVIGIAALVSLLSGPRGLTIWRVRYSLLAVLLGAMPLLAIPQGEDILQRLVEGTHQFVRIAFGVLALSATAIVTWYCARTMTRVRLSAEPPPDDPWLPFFERNVPRILGVATLLVAALAFAKAGDSVARFLALAVSSYLLAIALGTTRRQWIGKSIAGLFSGKQNTAAAKQDALLTDRLGRAVLGIVASVFIVFPDAPWPLSEFRIFWTDDTLGAFCLRLGAGGLLLAAWLLFLFVYFRRDLNIIRQGRAEELGQLRKTEVRELADGFPVDSLPAAVIRRALVAAGVGVAVFLLFTWWTVPVARELGPLVVLALIATNFVFVGSIVAYAGRRIRMPLLPSALAFAAILSLWNDNHAIRTLPPSSAVASQPLATRLDSWVKSQNRGRPAGDTTPIPLILAAASGGGLRAAYWAALGLATLQDKDSTFASHLFAVSGVSGGSLGGALFAAMMYDRASGRSRTDCTDRLADAHAARVVPGPSAADSPGPLVACVKRFMRDDFLSPVLAKFLTADIAQWFVPVPIASWDRATALEHSWESSYSATVGSATFAESFSRLMDASQAAHVPALVLNTTHVETGRRYVLAPFSDTALFLDAPNISTAMNGAELRVSTAVHNSARFSYVSPAGRIDRGDGISYGELVDGGYFENSGLASLHELRDAIELILQARTNVSHPRVHVVVLYFCNDPLSCKRDMQGNEEITARRATGGEWFAPARALLAAREARGVLARRELLHVMPNGDFIQLNVCDSLVSRTQQPTTKDSAAIAAAHRKARERTIDPPLGWLLSAQARGWMDASLERTGDTEANCVSGNVERMHALVALLAANSRP